MLLENLTSEVWLTSDDLEMILRLLAALVAGAIIGFERSFRGRPAGFRTHTLVCLASSLLMLVTVYEAHWVNGNTESVRLDPTRMSQGIMTGIGFLGAGVIMKEGLSVQGLTTAASIWITAAIGILAGIGFYLPLLISVILTISTLSVFRWIEEHLPSQAYYHFECRYASTSDISELTIRAIVEGCGFSIANLSYRFDEDGSQRRNRMVLRTTSRKSAFKLSEKLEATDSIQEFRITPTGD